MRSLQVLCIIGLAGFVLARPQVNKSHMPFGYKHIKSGGGGEGSVKRPLNPLGVLHKRPLNPLGVLHKRPLNPLGVLHNQYGLSKSVRKISHRQKVVVCDICPPAKDISPCVCTCNCNITMCLGNINCGYQLQTAYELQKILSSPSYPVYNYYSLLVEKTILSGPITKALLGTSVRFNEINIHDNGFEYIDKHAFNHSGPILKKLHLNNNQITQMDWHLLEDMPLIKYMDISSNRLTFIPGDALQSQHLRFLNFSHNDLGDVGMNAFKGLTRLDRLDLSHNALVTLGSSVLAFNNHKNGHLWVNISHNQISSVGDTAISGVKSISIDLKHNQLKALNEQVFRHFIDSTDGGIHIDVAGNPIECDCQLAWIVQNLTIANCFDDFAVCNSHISNITTENLGDC